MEFITRGKNFHFELQLPICYNPAEDLSALPLQEERFRLILLEKGSGVAHIGEYRGAFIAPAVFCLNERKSLVLEQGTDLHTRSIYFHPEFINSAFTLTNVYGQQDQFRWSERSDRILLRPFVERDKNYYGCLGLGSITIQRLSSLCNVIGRELSEQNDHYWACRSRSFFLELLILVERVFTSPGVAETIPLPKETGEIGAVILYLHTNYRRKITISELARMFHLNRTTLSAKFNETTGQSLIDYLIGLRIRLAAVLLRDTTIPITEIIDRTGFQDGSHFNRMFKKHTGYSPSDYRQKFCWVPLD